MSIVAHEEGEGGCQFGRATRWMMMAFIGVVLGISGFFGVSVGNRLDTHSKRVDITEKQLEEIKEQSQDTRIRLRNNTELVARLEERLQSIDDNLKNLVDMNEKLIGRRSYGEQMNEN